MAVEGFQSQDWANAESYIEAHCSENFVDCEQGVLKAALGERYRGMWTGIALSGGGVRSAVFCLGALQALTLRGILSKFDYMSTVSGGGYTGLSIQWFCRKLPELRSKTATNKEVDKEKRRDIDETTFPFGTVHPDPSENMGSASEEQRRTLQFLRDNISYLAPGGGITYYSGIFAVLRTVFLNLIVWVPIFTLVFLGLLYGSNNQSQFAKNLPSPIPNVAVCTDVDCMLESKKYELPFLFAILLWGAWFYFFFMGATSFATSFVGRGADAASPTRRTIDMVIFAVLAALFPVGLWMAWDGTPSLWDKALVIFAIVAGPIGLSMLWAYIRSIASARQPSYVLRRDFEVWFAKSANLIILVVVLGMLPLLHQLTGEEARADQYGVVGLAFGLVSALYGHYSSLRSLSPGIVGKVSINAGAVVFLISFLLICFAAAHKTMEEAKDIAWNVIACGIGIAEILTDKALDCSSVTGGGIDEKMLMAAAFVSIAILVGLVCLLSMLLPNINYIGLHRYYRDRLMETFLPGTKSLECGSSISSPDADKFEVARLANLFSEFNAGCRPFPLINTNIILVNETNRKTQIRGGASFVITPFFTGSNETGWIKTEQYEKGQGPIQLASAMAVSGAAANSNAGYTGIGITRNRLVSMVMLLLNIRLGLWLTNPKTLNSDLRASGWMRALRRMFFIRRPRHGHPGLTYGLFGWGYQGNSHFIELSDGGHFEDLGIYELVRRKASLIIACDGEADKEISYAGLVSAARRIQEDFGAVLIFEENAGPERLVPRVELGYPSNTQGARSPYLVARIRYNDGTEGVVIYIKATMVADLGFVARGYRGKNPDFPHQSTVDQFFQSEQFEAYRELGYRSALRCIDELNLENNFDEPTAVWRQYLDRIDRE